jgi:hypothetical protein
MSVTTYAKVLPRAATSAYLHILRLPLTAAQRVAGGRIDETSAPALAFESFEARVESGVGALLRDEQLLDSARLRREKVAKLRKATVLETAADEQRKDAEQKFQSQREKAEQQREDAARRAEQREADLERNAELHEQKVADKAAKKKAAARRAKAKQDEMIDRQERAAKVDALDAESEALEAAKDAVEAKQTVEVVNDTLEGQKEARKTG